MIHSDIRMFFTLPLARLVSPQLRDHVAIQFIIQDVTCGNSQTSSVKAMSVETFQAPGFHPVEHSTFCQRRDSQSSVAVSYSNIQLRKSERKREQDFISVFHRSNSCEKGIFGWMQCFLQQKNTWFLLVSLNHQLWKRLIDFQVSTTSFQAKISPIDSTDTRLDGELESSKPGAFICWKHPGFLGELNHLHMTKFYQNPFSPKC